MGRTEKDPHLVRALGFWALVLYGVGDILGAGIYALIGKVAGIAENVTWVAFMVALLVATLTGLSYAELSGRFPKSGGEATFAERAFKNPTVSFLVGWFVLTSGVVSMAAVSRAFSGYVLASVEAHWLASPLLSVGFLLVLAGIALWGIRQSSTVNIVFTLIEGSGLILVLAIGFWVYFSGATPAISAPADAASVSWRAIMQGAALAFFAFIGFEDMANVAEEVVDPTRTLPKAILTSLAIAGSIYVAVAFVSTAVVSPSHLSSSTAPLLEVVRRGWPQFPALIFVVIAAVAVSNTALLNLITASRLLLGMSQQGLAPQALGRITEKTHTPHIAIAVVFGIATFLALSGTLTFLAGTTSALLLSVFFMVNVSLIKIQRNRESTPNFHLPRFVPFLGALSTLTLLAFAPSHSLLFALGLGIAGLGVSRIVRSL